jgi:hypothetical protein
LPIYLSVCLSVRNKMFIVLHLILFTRRISMAKEVGREKPRAKEKCG